MLKVQLVKWGNSHAVRLPKSILQRAEIREGDELEVRVENGCIALQPAAPKLTLAIWLRVSPPGISTVSRIGASRSAGKYGENALCS